MVWLVCQELLELELEQVLVLPELVELVLLDNSQTHSLTWVCLEV